MFDFGQNWKDYSARALNAERLSDAKASLKKLFELDSFSGLSFLDVGCGSGIFSIGAKMLGAREVLGFDISQNSVEASRKNAAQFLTNLDELRFIKADVLDAAQMSGLDRFDLVYAWGSLHHTGRLWDAVEQTLLRVKPGGRLVLALYNRHVSSATWLVVKKIYNGAPFLVKKVMILFFYPLIFMAKFFITFRDPLKMRRGMDFYHDVVDWVGGYPYEYASIEEVKDFLQKRGFALKRVNPTALPTGNNEFLFFKI